jgi:NTP pyrophosphatase (non-canonical NTP hydrolase)
MSAAQLLAEYEAWATGELSEISSEAMTAGREAMSVASRRHKILSDVDMERDRQMEKWGEQRHPATYWVCILTEEVGEVAQACISDKAMIDDLRQELVQTAAVAVAWLECIDELTEGP